MRSLPQPWPLTPVHSSCRWTARCPGSPPITSARAALTLHSQTPSHRFCPDAPPVTSGNPLVTLQIPGLKPGPESPRSARSAGLLQSQITTSIAPAALAGDARPLPSTIGRCARPPCVAGWLHTHPLRENHLTSNRSTDATTGQPSRIIASTWHHQTEKGYYNPCTGPKDEEP